MFYSAQAPVLPWKTTKISAEVSPVTRTSADALVWVSSTSKQLNGLQEQKERRNGPSENPCVALQDIWLPNLSLAIRGQ